MRPYDVTYQSCSQIWDGSRAGGGSATATLPSFRPAPPRHEFTCLTQPRTTAFPGLQGAAQRSSQVGAAATHATKLHQPPRNSAFGRVSKACVANVHAQYNTLRSAYEPIRTHDCYTLTWTESEPIGFATPETWGRGGAVWRRGTVQLTLI